MTLRERFPLSALSWWPKDLSSVAGFAQSIMQFMIWNPSSGSSYTYVLPGKAIKGAAGLNCTRRVI